MNQQNFTTTILVDQSPKEAFDAINHVRGWWIDKIGGRSEKLNDEFDVQFEDIHYSKQKLIEVISDQKVVWQVIGSQLNFLKMRDEWTGTTISFEISKMKGKTQIKFTHAGLVPNIECYGACSNAWSEFINDSLFSLITTGKGKPFINKKTVETGRK